MIDAVLSYHLNPHTCGVAKFNQRLARELGVPLRPITYLDVRACSFPLVSIKPSEIDGTTWAWFPFPSCPRFDVFLHEWDEHSEAVARLARQVYAANPVIAAEVAKHRPDVIEAWCPSTIEGNAHRGTINVLTFGMAHKIQTARYEKLKALLDATGEDYTVSVSTAIHEGSPWDETARVADRLRETFGPRLRVLGYLADDAIRLELERSTAVALFFDPALRANNTTFWAAVDAGKFVITNCDEYSPCRGEFEIDVLTEWPTWHERAYVSSHTHKWGQLIDRLQGVSCAK